MQPILKNILFGLGCFLILFSLYKYLNSVAVEGFGDNTKTGFGTIDTTGLGDQAQVFIAGYNALGRMYYGGDAIPAVTAIPKVPAVLNPDNSIKIPAVPAKYGTAAQPAVAALPEADQLAIKRAIRNIIAEIESN
jgi:hypothetical protein